MKKQVLMACLAAVAGGLGRYGHLFFFVVPQRPRDGLPRAVGAGGRGQRLHLFRK